LKSDPRAAADRYNGVKALKFDSHLAVFEGDLSADAVLHHAALLRLHLHNENDVKQMLYCTLIKKI
jgi:hypothetical protein